MIPASNWTSNTKQFSNTAHIFLSHLKTLYNYFQNSNKISGKIQKQQNFLRNNDTADETVYIN